MKKSTFCIIPCALSSVSNKTMLKHVEISHSFTIPKIRLIQQSTKKIELKYFS